MSKLYYTLKKILGFGLDLYFVDIQSSGHENVPATGPVIFAANHPNSIMDTMILGFCSGRQVHYMARSGLFENPVVRFVFDRCGVIPLYRPQDGGDMAQNRSSFEAAFELLEAQKVLGIFPEGRNSQDHRVLDIKTGTARIALGAEARNDFALQVKIIPVGLNFQDRDRFLTSVLLRFGEPITVADWANSYREDDREAVRALTGAIQDGIESQTMHVENVVVWEMTTTLARIARQELLADLGAQDEKLGELVRESTVRRKSLTKGLLDRARFLASAPRLSERFDRQQLLANTLTRTLEQHPERFARLRADMRQYEDHLAQIKLRHDFGARHPVTLSSRREAFKLTLYAILVSPLAGWGFIHNVLPYQLVKLAKMRAPDEAIRAMTTFVAGTVIYACWYALLGWGLWSWNGETVWSVMLYVASLPLTGFIFLRYRSRVASWRSRILARTLFRTERNLVETLIDERERLLEGVERLVHQDLEAQALPDTEQE